MAEVTVSGAVPAEPVAGRIATHAYTGRFGELAVGSVRIVVGFLFACHGYQKLFGAFGRAPVPVGSWPAWWAGLIELGVGSLLAIGLFTRPAAVLCSGAMAYAYFTVHQAGGILPIENKGELAALYCWTFLLIAIVGPGSMALDTVRRRHRSRPS